MDGDTSVRASVTRTRINRIAAITAELRELRTQIIALVQASGRNLMGIYGAGPLVTARILAEVGDIRRYPTRYPFATANGSAPIPASSGRTVRHRLNRGGNRQLSRALYTIAITETRADTDGRAYHLRKRDQGKPAAKPSAASREDCPTSSTAPCVLRLTQCADPARPEQRTAELLASTGRAPDREPSQV